ncbi:MAG: hypothetical protein K2Y23_11990 [Cyanobacteria bacterium]|nr:hypothetical protein [Cyanobacteriota bacterium]
MSIKNSKTSKIAGAQLALQRTLKTLELDRVQTDRQIRLVRSALAAIGVQNPQLSARAKRKPMTAAERRSVSRRMKAYWAKKRAQKAS